MGHCIETRTSSILGNEEWKTLPWQNHEKDSLSYLFDIGFDLAAASQRTDVITQTNSVPSQKVFAELWSACLAIFAQLESWYRQHWPDQASGFTSTSISDPGIAGVLGSQSRPQFGSLWEATNIVYYWSFKVVLDQNVLALSELQNRISPQQQQSTPTPTPPPTGRSKAKFTSSSTRDASLASHGLTPSQASQIAATSSKLATDVVLSAPYFLADDTGWLGPQRLFFPLRQVMGYFGKRLPQEIKQFQEAKAAFVACIDRLRSSCADKRDVL